MVKIESRKQFPRISMYSFKLCVSHVKFKSLNFQTAKTTFLDKHTVYQNGVKLIFLVENIHRELNHAVLCQPKNKEDFLNVIDSRLCNNTIYLCPKVAVTQNAVAVARKTGATHFPERCLLSRMSPTTVWHTFPSHCGN